MTRDPSTDEQQKAFQTVSDMIEEIWGGLVLLIEDDREIDDAHKAMLRGLMRIANDRRSEVEVALGNAIGARTRSPGRRVLAGALALHGTAPIAGCSASVT